MNWTNSIETLHVIHQTPVPLPQVEWSKDGSPLSYLGPRPGVSLVTDKGERTVSSLLLAGATTQDTGTYLCLPRPWGQGADLPGANISLHVMEGAETDQLSGAGGQGGLPGGLLALALVTQARGQGGILALALVTVARGHEGLAGGLLDLALVTVACER